MTLGLRTAALPAAVLLLALTGCGGGADAEDSTGASTASEADAGEGSPAVDAEQCAADASPVPTPLPASFPADWPFPPGTVVHDVEDRADAGTIATGISTSSFQDVLAFMNHQVVDAGFRTEDGETEEHDAEAEWEGNGYRGRWAIRESATCQGETVVQVLALATSD